MRVDDLRKIFLPPPEHRFDPQLWLRLEPAIREEMAVTTAYLTVEGSAEQVRRLQGKLDAFAWIMQKATDLLKD